MESFKQLKTAGTEGNSSALLLSLEAILSWVMDICSSCPMTEYNANRYKKAISTYVSNLNIQDSKISDR